MKLLTVSIAAYHVEDYLRETLDSFLISEVTDQLEVLIVMMVPVKGSMKLPVNIRLIIRMYSV